MKKVLIIEDELLSAKRLKKMILDIDDTLEVDGPLQSVKDVVEYMQAHDDYDLVFSDIRLLDGDVFMLSRRCCRRRLLYSRRPMTSMRCRQ